MAIVPVVLAAKTGFFAVTATFDIVQTDGVKLTEAVVTETPSLRVSLHPGSLDVPSSLSPVGRGVLGVTVKDGTSCGGSTLLVAAKCCSLGERCRGEAGLVAASAVVATASSSPSMRLSTSLCE